MPGITGEVMAGIKKFKVCSESELSEGSVRTLKIFARQIAVYRIDGVIHAMDGLCKHMNAPLATTGKIKGTKLVCSWHGWEYDILSGECLNHSGIALRHYPVLIENGEIFIEFELNT
ncbi:Rieske (2Fe-2S) protein [bacterium]|nr:Rieske (2Fe-2S) protein [bacterium]